MRIDCAPELRRYIQERLSLKRYEHCLRTEETSRVLCTHFGFSPTMEDCGNDALYCCSVSGLCHDMARELPLDRILYYASLYGELTEWEIRSPVLAHGKAAAWLLKEKFGIGNHAVHEAVRTHTVAEPGMSSCGKIVYIADYIEPGRSHLEKDFLKRYESLSLDDLLFLVLERTLGHLREKERYIAEPSIMLFNELEREGFGMDGLSGNKADS